MKLPKSFILEIDTEVNDDTREHIKELLKAWGIQDVDWYFVDKKWYVRNMEIMGIFNTCKLFYDIKEIPVVKFSSLM